MAGSDPIASRRVLPETVAVGKNDLRWEAFHAKEQGRIVRDALAVLTVHEREAIQTAFFSELTHAEAAERLNEPLGTVKTRIRSALMKLRHALAGKL